MITDEFSLQSTVFHFYYSYFCYLFCSEIKLASTFLYFVCEQVRITVGLMLFTREGSNFSNQATKMKWLIYLLTRKQRIDSAQSFVFMQKLYCTGTRSVSLSAFRKFNLKIN